MGVLIPLIAYGALMLASNGTRETFVCKFDHGVVIIERQHGGNALVQINGEARRYNDSDEKLVAEDPGLPVFYFQIELKRWKRLTHEGETIEITVCKTAATPSAQVR